METKCFALGSLRQMPPAAPSHRLRAALTTLLVNTLPNGMPNPSPVAAETALTLGADFRLTARMVRQARGWVLEIRPVAYDMARRRLVRLAVTPELAAAVYDVMRADVLRERARGYRRTEGRN